MPESMTSGPLSRDALLAAGYTWLFDTTFLCQLTIDDQARAVAAMQWRNYPTGSLLVTQGTDPPGLELIARGNIAVEKKSERGDAVPIATLGPGHIVGERSLLLRTKTSADVRAMSPTRTLHLPAVAFYELLERSPDFGRYITNLVSLRGQSAKLHELLLRHPFMRSLGRDDLDRFVQSGELLRVPAGDNIVRMGDRTTDVYLVVSGEVGIFVRQGDGTQRELVGTNGPGWIFGHAAALLRTPRTADIDALEATELLSVDANSLMAIVQRNPQLRRKLVTELAAKDLNIAMAQELDQRAETVVVFGSKPGIGATSVAYGVASALAETCKIVLVDGDGARNAERLGLKSDEHEVGGLKCFRVRVPDRWDFQIYYPADHKDLPDLIGNIERASPPDTLIIAHSLSRDDAFRRTIREAENVVHVRGASDPLHEETNERHHYRLDAVRIEKGVALPIETAAHCVRIPDDMESIERAWRTADIWSLGHPVSPFGRAMGRLGRALLGRTVGLALGGGGALGFAHIGLLRALESAGIPVDMIAGASFGSLVGGFYAAGGMKAVEALVRDRYSLIPPLAAGFVSTLGFEKWTDRQLKGAGLGETEIPFYPVGVDVETGREVVVSYGSIGRGVRSSSCLPGAYPALQMGGARVVDGGINNNVPASVPWEAGAHFIVASNIIPSFPFAPRDDSGGRVKRALWRTFGRFDDVVRSLFLLMSQSGRDRAQIADFVFDLELRGYNVYDFANGDRIADAGQRQAEALLPDILYTYKNAGRILTRASSNN